jgi:hypothetical protein
MKYLNGGGDGGSSNGGAPCLAYKPQQKYFNSKVVKEALGVRIEQSGEWEFCSDYVGNHYDTTIYKTMHPFYRNLLNSGIRILVYSGDCDLAVNTIGTELSMYKLMDEVMPQSSIETKWKSWIFNNQVAGFYQTWQSGQSYLTFKTVKG